MEGKMFLLSEIMDFIMFTIITNLIKRANISTKSKTKSGALIFLTNFEEN